MGAIRKIQVARIVLQAALLIVSLLLIAEGLWGHQFAPKNLTTMFVWVHYRGLLIFALLLWGNLFCMACPFMLVRNAARVFIKPPFSWPEKLQNKWTALFLFALVLFLYEYFSLWSSPFKTSLLILLFFAGALIIDSLFKKSSFCKYVCPIGQFNFITSTLSPKTVKEKSLSVCDACTTLDCIRGNESNRGCELGLFMPKKTGNLDCNFCMDCVSACPHDNISLASTVPGSELLSDHNRSGIGKLSSRKDWLALIIAFVFLGLMNAFLMTGPAAVVKTFFKEKGIEHPLLVLLFFFVLFSCLLPILILSLPEFISRKNKEVNYMMWPALLPLGVGIWCAHYSFHLLTGFFTFVPLITKASFPAKWMGLPVSVVFPIEAGLLSLGLLGSVMVCLKLSSKKEVRLFWISAMMVIALFSFWIFTLPMDMRSTFIGLTP